jgi:hypothetical protein
MSRRRWIARPYREGDEERIFELHKALFSEREYNHDKWMEWWRWLYRKNPTGKGYIWVAEDSGKIIGQSASIFFAMKMADRTLTVWMGTDNMTHPNYRRQGVYRAVFDNKKREIEKHGFHTRFGFPNANARIAQKSIDNLDIAKLRIMVKPLNWKNLLQSKTNKKAVVGIGAVSGPVFQRILYGEKKAPVFEGLAINRVSYFDGRIDELWNKVSSQYQIMVVRKAEYLNWKYVSIPNIEYSIYLACREKDILGYIVFRTMQWGRVKIGVIYDLLAETPVATQYLLGKVVRQCREEKADLVYSRLIAAKSCLDVYKKSGFISVPFNRPWLVSTSYDTDFSNEFLLNRDNWYVQIGDSDFL